MTPPRLPRWLLSRALPKSERRVLPGDLDEEFSTIFRTMPVAFAYAEMSAAFERYAAAELESVDDDQIEMDLEATERNFIDLSDRLCDSGVNGIAIKAWERQTAQPVARVLH